MQITVDIDEEDLQLAGVGDESGYMHIANSVLKVLRKEYPEIYKEYFED